ncbi:L-threonylcarbamoyladenylate synthase [Actinoallomurus spadix]|uniref:L-threonylcarbamoyladenylate synthase n=1 Tax=Actinoallomurus spadix TaxID=79912 RepID=UPI0020923F82|nr:L-threonylcarbamoyladenylate synthase [Actinoallomurus spadix]MCO5990060.1 L-threonylcarbamoyladenylate synthase [Actinoallomurus spadix]
MSRRYDCSDPLERTKGIADAVSAVRRGELVVLPTDTVYGIGADAFTPSAVTALLDAKGRGRDMPSPVLVGSVRAAQALVDDLGTYGQDLIDEFWPGALTIVCRANTTLAWDLGDTKGTVAIRMPLHQLALELLKETGPMAVSSANRSGAAPSRTAEEAEAQLGDSVSVYLDGGPSGDEMPSSIVDLTGAVPRLLRAGAIPEERLREVCGVLLSDEDDPAPAAPPADDQKDATKAADSSQGGRSPLTEADTKTFASSEGTDSDKDTPPADR